MKLLAGVLKLPWLGMLSLNYLNVAQVDVP